MNAMVPPLSTNTDASSDDNGNGSSSSNANVVEEIMVLALSYRKAQDEDIISAINMVSSARSQQDVDGANRRLQYFVVPMSWFRKAAPILYAGSPMGTALLQAIAENNEAVDNTSSSSNSSSNSNNNAAAAATSPNYTENWKEDVGPIQNASLVDESLSARKKPPPPFLNELQKKTSYWNNQNGNLHGFAPAIPSSAPTKTSTTSSTATSSVPAAVVASHYQHSVDYILVGSNVWLLLSSKFGHDVELAVRCVYAPRPVRDIDIVGSVTATSVHVHVNDNQRVPVPTTGRFPYEKYFQKPTPAPVPTSSRNVTAKAHAQAHVVAPDDEDDDMHDVNDGPATVETEDPAARSDAESDLFPDNDAGSTETGVRNDDIIYLPNSQNADADSSTSNNNHWNVNHRNSDGGFTNNRYYESDASTSHATASTNTRIVRRRYGSGLGNLGNTCFMNSTLQCLAHTEPLQHYFLTGAYIPDLNRDNPLGTGGELATQFAQLLAEMWCSKQVLRQHGYGASSSDPSSLYTTSAANVVYPRSFKITLGKHAEQFMGYDQHDSQELATYLLDALHEDCNRVTNKPYIEKPEQTKDETDQEASDKAWELHLKREDSRVLENFMGQVKSRVQCNEPECGRVSTTFDPFMFLSVPIPGTEERSIPFTYIPLATNVPPKKMSVLINKMSTVEEMLKTIVDMLPLCGFQAPALEDLIVCDIWKKAVFAFLTPNCELEKIRDSDETFVYELLSVPTIHKLTEQYNEKAASVSSSLKEFRDTKRLKRYQLDVPTMTRLNGTGVWMTELESFMKHPSAIAHAFAQRHPNVEHGVMLYRHLIQFLNQCQLALESSGDDSAGQKRTRSDTVEDSGTATEKSAVSVVHGPSDASVKEICDICDESLHFKKVSSKQDLAILEFLSGIMLKELVQLEQKGKGQLFPNGVIVEFRIRGDPDPHRAGFPFVYRLPAFFNVADTRRLLADRLRYALKSSEWSQSMQDHHVDVAPTPDEPLELWILRSVPLLYQRKSISRGGLDKPLPLGSISLPLIDGAMAQKDDKRERESIAELVGDSGQVFVELSDDMFDYEKYISVDKEPQTSSLSKDNITVLDCIEKFCQMEQLEESEQWYCDRCKKHVCAWKQFHIYRSPPHLIVHLKRFSFSARTHRRNKIGVHVDFPLEGLDLMNQVLHWTDDEKPIYDCYAVSNHYGGLGGGHYTAYALNDGDVWCHYDDSRISSDVPPSEVVSSAAYVLYYRRRDVPVGMDLEMAEPTPDQMVMRPPVIIQDAPLLGNGHKLSRDSSEISSNVAMVDDEEGMEDATDIASRSASPASDAAQRDRYRYNNYSYDDYRTPVEQEDEGDSSEPSGVHGPSGSSLPLQ